MKYIILLLALFFFNGCTHRSAQIKKEYNTNITALKQIYESDKLAINKQADEELSLSESTEHKKIEERRSFQLKELEKKYRDNRKKMSEIYLLKLNILISEIEAEQQQNRVIMDSLNSISNTLENYNNDTRIRNLESRQNDLDYRQNQLDYQQHLINQRGNNRNSNIVPINPPRR